MPSRALGDGVKRRSRSPRLALNSQSARTATWYSASPPCSVIDMPAHVADRHRHLPLAAELQPAQLVVLQAVARSLDLDHPVATLRRPELDQVRQAGAVARDILQQAFEPGAQVGRRQAIERLFEQFLAKQLPVDEGRLQAELVAVATADRVAVATVLQPSQAGPNRAARRWRKSALCRSAGALWKGWKNAPGMAAKIASQQSSPNSELIRPFST